MDIVINRRLKELRKEKKETQVQVAAAIEVAEQYYQKLEYGLNLPGIENTWKLADHFGVTIDYLVGRTDTR
nr:helix-turn-helix transcriptional regulator [uncultured Oscillibacter sp.]